MSVSLEWKKVPGITAQDISVGKTGAVWATGAKGEIYRKNGTGWEQMPGGASRIAVNPVGDAWVVNAGGEIYKYNSTSKGWEKKPGRQTEKLSPSWPMVLVYQPGE